MGKQVLLLLMALSVATSAAAQTKFTGKVHCAKADPDYSIEVGDKPGHVLTARKSACTWTESTDIAGLKVKSAQDVATGEVNGTSVRDSGYHVATMDNGDTYAVHFNGNAVASKDKTAAITGKWTFVSGTGKLKGIKGGGTYKGTSAADGSVEVEVEGEYAVAAKTTAPSPTKQQ
jgi:nitrous oxidase accessory protein NosD